MARTMIILTNADAHIAGFPEPTRNMLEKLRSVIRAAAPKAEETINYGIPTFKQDGKNLIHFAGYKNHIGFYPGADAIETFKKELAIYTLSKGTIQFPLDKPLPVTLVKQIVKYNLTQIQETQKTLKPKTSKQKNFRTAPNKSKYNI